MAKATVSKVKASADELHVATNTPKKPKVSYKGRKAKGSRFENEIAKALNGKRVPLSGALSHLSKELSEDVVAQNGERIQCKVQHDGFKQLYSWLVTADMAVVKADGKVPLVVVPLPLFQDIYFAQELAS